MNTPTVRHRPRHSRSGLHSACDDPPVDVRSAAWSWCLALFPLVCVFLGGTTVRWSQGFALAMLGALLAYAPPRFSVGWKLNLTLAAFAALTLTAYLPAHWFATSFWRATLRDDLGIVLPSTLTPQPWMTAESAILFLAGICWFYMMGTVNWSAAERLRAGRVFAAGLVMLAGVCLLLPLVGIVMPIWPNERHFGPFPNRNQTADFFAVGSLPVLACVLLAFRRGRDRAAAAWAGGWLVVATAAFDSFSRAGVILLILGSIVCLCMEPVIRRRERGARNEAEPLPVVDNGSPVPAARKTSGTKRGWRMATPGGSPIRRRALDVRMLIERWRGGALAVSLVAILLSAFMLLGRDTLKRLTPDSSMPNAGDMTADFRIRIQSDAIHMMLDSSWCGLGLGNFASVFPVYRADSAIPARAIHPESDWFWMACELGWPSPVLALAGLVFLFQGLWPWRQAADGRLRIAAAVAMGLFAVHSAVDVSTHRLGTCFSAFFILSLALRGEIEGVPPFRSPATWTAPFFRVIGGVLVLVGCVWILEACGVLRLPGERGIAGLHSDAVAAAKRRDYASVEREMDQALAWAPLSWNAYFTRGVARAYRREDLQRTAADFRRARYLEPFIGDLPFDEACVWLATGHSAMAVNALIEACRREPERASAYMEGFYRVAPEAGSFQAELGDVAGNTPLLTLPFLNELKPPQNKAFIAAYLRADPDLANLSPAEQTKFFELWSERGDAAHLAETMNQRQAWQRLGWRWWAQSLADAGEFGEACRIAMRFASAPVLPSFKDEETVSRAELDREASESPADVALAFRQYNADRKAGDVKGALAAAGRITSLATSPAYFHYLEASAAAEAGNWARSWNAWRNYLHAIGTQE